MAVVRILFVLDACDREIIAWSAVANAGISGEMVRDLMIAAVERRFKRTCTPHPVDWLSDNGSASASVLKPTSQVSDQMGCTPLAHRHELAQFTPPPSRWLDERSARQAAM